nr:protein abrupt-like [Lepeophtheirus salmonis]
MEYHENLCIKWNEYESNLKEGLSELLHNEELFDVTLISGSRVIKAHKVILSACSPVFRSIIQSVSFHPHPVIYLKDINFDYLELILSFLYYGEMRVASDVINDLLCVADVFQIKGLYNNTNTSATINGEDIFIQSNSVEKSQQNYSIVQDQSRSASRSLQNSYLNNGEYSALKTKEENKSSSRTLHPSKSKDLYSSINKSFQHQSCNTNPNKECQDIFAPNSSLNTKRENPDESFLYSLESSYNPDLVDGVQSNCDGDVSYDMANSSSRYLNNACGREAEGANISTKDDNEKYQQSLKSEIKKHFKKSINKGFECKKCKYATFDRTSINRHIKSRHMITKGFRCHVCNKNYKTIYTLRRHNTHFHKRESVVIM